MPTVLKNISVKINKGEYVAFTGHSGCGKSTVLKLLMSIYKLDSGERFITDKSGESALTAHMRRLFAYVPQGNQLMSGTVRDIVSFADKTEMHNDEKIAEALRIACADGFISELEHGIDTLLGERGTGLSEGRCRGSQLQGLSFRKARYFSLTNPQAPLMKIPKSRYWKICVK